MIRPHALLVVATVLTAGAGCRGASGNPAPPARQIIVAVDLSGSQTQQTLRDSRQLLDKLIDDLTYGDQIVLLEMNRTGVRGDLKRFADSVPALKDPSFASSRDKRRLQGVKAAMHGIVPLIFDTTLVGKIPHTDIFSTLHTASEYARDANGRKTTVVLLSDMLQSANGVEMWRLRGMPAVGWVAKQKAAGMLPNLKGTCVAVVGADYTTKEGAAVKRFWVEYLGAAGATVGDYRILATQASGVKCA